MARLARDFVFLIFFSQCVHVHTVQPHANVRHALFSLLIRNDIMQGGNKVEVKMEEQQSQNEEKVQKMDFTV